MNHFRLAEERMRPKIDAALFPSNGISGVEHLPAEELSISFLSSRCFSVNPGSPVLGATLPLLRMPRMFTSMGCVSLCLRKRTRPVYRDFVFLDLEEGGCKSSMYVG